jgi:hypothetical protein
MANDRDRLKKVLALAMHPQTVHQEAIAAFHRARDLVKANPPLAHPPEQQPPAPTRATPEATFTANITSVHPDWILILVESLSKKAYELDLKSQITFDFSQSLTAVKVACDGSAKACETFESHMNWAINYINEKIKKAK